MSGRAAVLVVDDERDMAESCAYLLERAGCEVVTAFSGEEALDAMQGHAFQLVITDLRMPRMSGLQLLAAIKQQDPDVEVLLMTGFPEIQTAVAAIKQGAWDYLTKPYVEKELMERVEKALAHRQVKEHNQALKERLRSGSQGRQLLFRSEAFAQTVAVLEKAARTDASVLIQGESGTGKELLAHRLHDQSSRAGRPFVPLDCAAIPEALVESELFGHVKGAFSGSTGNKPGLFQVADGGTLFLDEIGELPLPFQPKLLRAIQERHIRPVGSAEQVAVDVRIVCATNRNLQQEVAGGRFRPDLFYRLDVVRIDVPPLRDRTGDVALLAAHFLEKFAHGTAITGMDSAVMEALSGYDWPGNVRQLRNALERVCALAPGPLIRLQDLPDEIVTGQTPSSAAAADEGGGTFQEVKARKVAAIESSYIAGLLQKHGGNVTRSAEEAGMTRSAFQKLMQRYGIRSSEYRG